MARTQAADYEERREAIVAKAAQLFAENGFLGASVLELANACQTSKSLLYHYYPSKEDVLYAVMASHIDRLVADVDQAMAVQGKPEQRLKTLLRLFMKDYVGAAAPQKVLLNDLRHLPDEKRHSIVAKQRRILDTVQALLVELDPTLADQKGKARAKTMLLFGMINWTGNWYDPAGPLDPESIADMAFNLAVG